MKRFIFTCGISGSGKSTYLKGKSPLVETDQMRKELLGNVDDLSREKFIFDTAIERIVNLFEKHNIVYFEATMVENKHRTPFLDAIKEKVTEMGFKIDFLAIVFQSDVEKSIQRITKDLKDKFNRAKSIHLLQQQYKYYLEAMDVFESGKDKYISLANIEYYQ